MISHKKIFSKILKSKNLSNCIKISWKKSGKKPGGMPGRLIVRKNSRGMHIMAILPHPIRRVERKVHQVNSHQKKNPKTLHLKILLINNKKI